MKRTVAVVGLGLVGGSLARALTRAGYRVAGFDRAAVARRARRARAVAATPSRLEEAVRGADVVVLAAPPAVNRRLLSRVAAAAGGRTVITDVGSAKGPIVREAGRLRLRSFVGSHPMAGRAGSGFAAGSAGLFRGRTWIVTPSSLSAPSAVRAVRALARAVGARPVAMDAATHDRVMAFLSHVPQVVAWALLDAARSDAVARRHLAAAGPGFRDMTRLAASPPALWRGILAENAREVRPALAALRRALDRVEGRMVRNGR